MKGTQKSKTPGTESMVIRVDRRMYMQLLEWSQLTGMPIRAMADAVLWHYFTKVHRHAEHRALVLQQAKAISESIRSRGSTRAEEMLPRWAKPKPKNLIPEAPAMPPPPSGA